MTDARGLVRDHGDEPVTAVLSTHVLDDVACDLVLGDEACTEALALLSEEAIEGPALQRSVDLIHTVADGGELDLPRGEELPVAVVPEGDEHAVILFRCLHEGREIGHNEVLLGEVLGALVQELRRGEEVVGELQIEVPLDLSQLRCCLLGEATGEVASHDGTAIAHDPPDEEGGRMAQRVDDRPR